MNEKKIIKAIDKLMKHERDSLDQPDELNGVPELLICSLASKEVHEFMEASKEEIRNGEIDSTIYAIYSMALKVGMLLPKELE